MALIEKVGLSERSELFARQYFPLKGALRFPCCGSTYNFLFYKSVAVAETHMIFVVNKPLCMIK